MRTEDRGRKLDATANAGGDVVANKVRRRLAAVALALLVIQFGFLVFGVLSLLPRGDEYDEEREHLKDVRNSEPQ